MTQRKDFFGERRGYHHGRLKDALIEAARSLVAERGPAGFTLSEAAKRVGVTGAAPYRHFTDRNDLMSELARRGFDTFAQRLEKAWDNGQPDAVTAFRRLGAAYLSFAREEPGLYAAMFGNVQALKAPTSGAAADRALAMIHYACAAVLRQYGASDATARELALQVWAFSHGVAQLALSGHLDGAAIDPPGIMMAGVSNIVEMAVRRAVAGAK
jgi:AcrR family transcriptional regulator